MLPCGALQAFVILANHPPPSCGFIGAAQSCRVRMLRIIGKLHRFQGYAKPLKVHGDHIQVHQWWSARWDLGPLANLLSISLFVGSN